MQKIDFSKNGGFPLTQNALEFLQTAFKEPMYALGAMFGNKTIITGMEVGSGSVAEGWFIYNGEPIKFTASSLDTKVSISENLVSVEFEDGLTKAVYKVKTAVCSPTGDFNFSDLVRLQPYNAIEKLKLDRTWLTGDVKEVDCSLVYLAANFDSTGLGTNERLGWAICNGNNGTKDRRGLVSVGYDERTGDPVNGIWDALYATLGAVGGEKKHLLTSAESGVPAHHHPNTTREPNTGGSAIGIGNGGASGSADTGDNTPQDAAQAHENRQPFIVTLFIQKL